MTGITIPTITLGSSDIGDTGMVPRGIDMRGIFSLADSTGLQVPSTAWAIPAAVMQQPNGAGMQQSNGRDQPAPIGHNSGAQPMQEDGEVEGDAKAKRIAILQEQIALVIGAQRLAAAMAASDIGNLANLTRLKVLRTSLLLGAVRHCRRNPQADSRLAILGFITFLSDNKLGMCRLSVRRVGRILQRSDQAIVTSIASLEKDGQIGVLRRFGAGSYYWPLIPAELVAADPHLVWLIDAIDHHDQTAQGGLTTQAALSGRNHSSSLERSGSEHRKPLKSRIYNRSSSLESISLKSSQEEKTLGADAPGVDASLFSDEAPSEGTPPPSKGAPCKPSKPSDVEEALAAYNAAAAAHRFTPCRTPTDVQAGRLRKRLKGIGGLANFKRALAALPLDDFLMGRVPGKGGGKPYRLSLDGLMRTTDANGNPRDVLGKLLELADARDGAGTNDAADPNAALQHLVASPFGQRTIEREGREKGMEILRARIAANRRGAASDA